MAIVGVDDEPTSLSFTINAIGSLLPDDFWNSILYEIKQKEMMKLDSCKIFDEGLV